MKFQKNSDHMQKTEQSEENESGNWKTVVSAR